MHVGASGHLALDGFDRALEICLGLVLGLALVAWRGRAAGSRVPDLGPVHMLQRDDLVEDRPERLGVLLVHDRDQGGRVMLQLAEHGREQQLADFQPLIDEIVQLDQLQHSMRFVGKTGERRASRRPHHGDVVTKPAQLVLHQLAVFLAQPVLVTMEQIPKLDVVKASVVALGSRRQVHAHSAVRRAPQPGRKHEER